MKEQEKIENKSIEYKSEGLTFMWAKPEDIELLTEIRIQVLRAANGLSDEVNLNQVEGESKKYFQNGFRENTFLALFVKDGEKIIGTGGISFYQVMPTCSNPTGQKAYIMNMYTHPDYRRRGIGMKTLDILIQEARRRGITTITLEATRMGKPLYIKYGFLPMADEMALPN